MADGSLAQTESADPDADENHARGASWRWRSRRGVLTILAATAAVVLTAAAAWQAFLVSTPLSPQMMTLFVGATAALVLPLLLLLLDPFDNMAQGPRLGLPLATLALLAGLAGFTAADRTLGLDILSVGGGLPGTAPGVVQAGALAVFFIYLLVALVPRIWNAALFAAFKQNEIDERARNAERKRQSVDVSERQRAAELHKRQADQNDAEALSAVIGTGVAISVLALAWVAGESTGVGLEDTLGVWISAGVIGLFAVVIFLKWISESGPVRTASRMMRGFSKRMGWLAAFYNALDAVLVRIGAHVGGAEHHSMTARYVVLAGTLGSLAVMAWYLPEPFGLVPAVIAFVVAFSVSRLWSWVEDDRNMAAITRFNPDAPQRVGLREDYRDETLLGFGFLLVLIPIAMMQADTSRLLGGALFIGEDKDHLREWIAYFGFELAKALPVVDWADIYKLQPGEDLLAPTEPLGMHAVFAARVTVDLLLIAALFQAIAVATRNRQQKALYAAGHIDRLDEMVERDELKRALAIPLSRRFEEARVDFRVYNPDRLRELYTRSRSAAQRAFIKTIFDQSGRELEPAINVLDRIARTDRNETFLHRTFDAVVKEHLSGVHFTPIGDLRDIMENLRATSGLKALKVEMMEFAARIGSPADVAEMLTDIMVGLNINDRFQYTRVEAARILTGVVAKLSEASLVSDILSQLESNRGQFGSAVARLEQLLAALRARLEELSPNSSSSENKP